MKCFLSIISQKNRSKLGSTDFKYQHFPFNGNTNHSPPPFLGSCLDLTNKCHKTTGVNVLLMFLSQLEEGNFLELEYRAEKKEICSFWRPSECHSYTTCVIDESPRYFSIEITTLGYRYPHPLGSFGSSLGWIFHIS